MTTLTDEELDILFTLTKVSILRQQKEAMDYLTKDTYQTIEDNINLPPPKYFADNSVYLITLQLQILQKLNNLVTSSQMKASMDFQIKSIEAWLKEWIVSHENSDRV